MGDMQFVYRIDLRLSTHPRISRKPSGAVLITNLALPDHASYTFRATLRDINGEEVLNDETLVIDTSRGLAIHELDITAPRPIETLLNQTFGGRTPYLAVISALIAILLAVLKKRIEKAFDKFLDWLGGLGFSKLSERRFLKAYRFFLGSSHRYLNLTGLGAMNVSRPLLEEVFISLRVSARDRNRSADSDPTEGGIAFESAVRQFERLVILGGPGAGKTTTLSYVVMQWVKGTMRSKLGLSRTLLPLFIPLRRLVNNEAGLLDDVLALNTQVLPVEVLSKLPRGYLDRKLRNGECLVLFDGLDEVVDQGTHQRVAEKINLFVSTYGRNRFIVTCRVAGWQDLIGGFVVLEAENLSPKEVHRFISGWHRAVIPQERRNYINSLYKTEEERETAFERERGDLETSIDSRSRELINGIDNNPRLLVIARTPMLLSLLCIVHYKRGDVPRERAILYGACLELLTSAWESAKGIKSSVPIKPFQKEALLRAIALTYQSKGITEASKADIIRIINSELEKMRLDSDASETLTDIVQRTGILTERSIGVYGFAHLTLQEYLVAKHLTHVGVDGTIELSRNFDNQEWREVIQLYAGLTDDSSELINKMLVETNFDRLMLAAFTLGEANSCNLALTKFVLDEMFDAFLTRDDVVDVAIRALAAVCSDYVASAIKPEQVLSEKLIALIQGGHPRAEPAIRVLALARITRALPFVVARLADSAVAVDRATIDALALFGNVCLTELLRLCKKPQEPPIGRIISVLVAIDTAEAARALVAMYGFVPDTTATPSISLALAKMLKNEIIEQELQRSSLDVSSLSNLSRIEADQTLWPLSESVTPAYYRLAARLRDDIVRVLDFGLKESAELLGAMNFRIVFPAIIIYLRKRRGSLQKDNWKDLGFEVNSEIDLLALNHANNEIASAPPLRNSIRAIESAHVSVETVAIKESMLRKIVVSFMGFLWWIDSVLALGLFGIALDLSHNSLNWWLLLLALPMVRIMLFDAWAVRAAGDKSKLRAVLLPTPLFLRRTPFITGMNRWVNFAVVQFAIALFSVPGMVFTLSLLPANSFTYFEVLFFCPNALFILACSWYYSRVVSRIDGVAILLSMHETGRRLLGIADSSVFTAAKAP